MADEDEERAQALHFTLHLDKPLPCHVEIAAWNPEKDLLAMVSADHQLTVHRFNWQKLWSVTPDKTVTSICWRPDGKALAVGHEDGEISLHDVENGEIVRKIEIHSGSIRCLHWIEEKSILTQDGVLLHEGRTSRFFPQAPKPPPMPGTGSAFDMVASGENEEYTRQNEASKPSQQSLNILCSADSNGVICLNAFGMFPIGELKLDDFSHEFRHKQLSALKVMVSNDLCSLILLCGLDKKVEQTISISMDTTLLNSRRKEIRQVALEASSVEELLEVFQTTLTVMKKHWMDSISPFTEKFTAFQALLREHGSQSTPREELLSLLACGSASASLHQFLAVSLGEEGLKKLAKSIDGAGKKLHMLIAEHLQPCAEIVAFRIGELLGLSRWRSQLQSIGVEETLVNNVMESAGMLLVQVERFLHIVSQTLGQFRLFFLWLTKSLRQLNGEPAFPQEQSTSLNSAAIAFLKSQFECDPIGPHITSEGVLPSTVLTEEQLKAEELLLLGGFKDVNFLQRTLFQQFNSLRASWKEAFSKPVKVISPKLSFQSHIYLCDSPSTLSSTFYELNKGFIDYTCFQMHEKGTEYIGVVSGFSPQDEEYTQVVALQLANDLTCVDFALYKEKQLVLLLSRKVLEGGNAWIMVLQLERLPFTALRTSSTDLLQLCISNDAVSIIDVTSGKVRLVPQDVIPPLAVSASRGLACVFAAQRRALLYDLEEDEEEKIPRQTKSWELLNLEPIKAARSYIYVEEQLHHMCLFRFNDLQKMAPKVFSFNSTPQTGKGESNQVVHGYSCIKGKGKHPMEDVLVSDYREVKGHKLDLFAVYDGHLGRHVAVFLKDHLFDNILKEPELFTDPKTALKNAYHSTDAVILEKAHELGPGGSTAVTAIVVDNKKLLVANVGDSRAVICEDGEGRQLSVDHEPNSERDLVESRGGHVTSFPGDVARVDGQLAVARAFGDKSLKQHLSAEPDFFEVSLTERSEFLILGSDGLWKVLENQQAVDLIKDVEDPECAARCLTDAALGKKSRDDISCIVVRFDCKRF